MVLEGKNIISIVAKLIGDVNPLKSAPGTIRGDFSNDNARIILYGSSNENEIKIWFQREELILWE